jgi:hypothetical protein
MHHILKMLDFLMLLVIIESEMKRKIIFTNKFFFIDRQAWIALGDMSKDKAMKEYVKLLFDRYSIFRDYLQAQRVTGEETDRIK